MSCIFPYLFFSFSISFLLGLLLAIVTTFSFSFSEILACTATLKVRGLLK